MMNIMVDKKYLRRKKETGGYSYRARVTEHATSRRMLRDLVDRAFDGSSLAVVQRLIDTGDLNHQELDVLRRLIGRKAKESSS